MKKIIIGVFLFTTLFAGYTCEELIDKYNAPNPERKTMKQLKRWVKHNISENDRFKDQLLECLIEQAADNPNRETIAAE